MFKPFGISDVGISTMVETFWKSDMEEFDDRQGRIVLDVWHVVRGLQGTKL